MDHIGGRKILAETIFQRISSLIEDPINRSRYIIKGKIIFSGRKNIDRLNEIFKELQRNEVYYITIESGKKYFHLVNLGSKTIGCYSESTGSKGMECLDELRSISGEEGRIIVYHLASELVGDEIRSIKEIMSSETVKEAPMEKLLERRKTPIELVEYEILNEITKYGYLAEEVSITTTTKDVMVFIKLNPIDKPPSLTELLYMVARHICSEVFAPDTLGIEIEHKKKKLIKSVFNGNLKKCLGLGMIPEILRNNGLQLTDLKVKEYDDTIEILVKAKRLSQELNISPENAVKSIRDSLRNIFSKNIRVKLSTGLFGGKYEA